MNTRMNGEGRDHMGTLEEEGGAYLTAPPTVVAEEEPEPAFDEGTGPPAPEEVAPAPEHRDFLQLRLLQPAAAD
ncbi:hypothetical protein PRIPAC_93658, partial [Pristionchus pacificus]